MSGIFFIYPSPLTIYSRSASSTTLPPTSAFPIFMESHILKRYVVSKKLIGVYIHLVLFYKASDGCRFSDSGDCRELVSHIPVLYTPELCKVVTFSFNTVLKDPSNSCCVWSKRGGYTLW